MKGGKMGKKKNKPTTEEDNMDTAGVVDLTTEGNSATLEMQPWDESFEGSDHKHYMRMSAEAIQAAANVALAERDSEKLLVTAEQWGRLARLGKEMTGANSHRIGFSDDEEDD
jgi:hypothetical protein